MARSITITTELGTVTITTYVGPARLSDRRCVQIGDAVVLDRAGVQELHQLLGHWLAFGGLPPSSAEPGSEPPG